MALGLQTESAGGDFLPIVKFDARAGRFFRRDRANGENTDVDITRNFKAVFDLENIEVGYINFATGGAPDYVVVPLGDPLPQRPSDGHKQGFRLLAKLHADCGGDVREFSSCAKVVIKGIDQLHEAYTDGVKQNPGKLPVVALKDTVAVTTEGKQKSTNYQPVLEIIGWAPRPKDLVHTPRAKLRQAAPAPATAPATGSTLAAPPAAGTASNTASADLGFG